MAEGGAEQSVTPFQHAAAEMCGECLLMDNSLKNGQWFCQQCRQRLCDDCSKYHRNVSSTKSHKIIPLDDVPATISVQQEEVSDEIRAISCQTHNEPIEFYCQNHKTPVCGTCKLMTHRKCQLQDLDHASKGSTGRNLQALQQLREAEANMKQIVGVIDTMIESLEAQKTKAIGKIKKKIEELEQEEIANVEKTFQQEHDVLDRESCDIKKSTILVQKRIEELERATHVGSEEEIFVATRQAEHDVAKFHDIVRESRQMSNTNMYFESDITSSLGKLCVEKATLSVNVTPKVNEVINTQKFDTKIVWFDILPSEKLLLLEMIKTSEENQLILYSSDKKQLSQLDLPAAVSADTLNDNQVIVALHAAQELQVVNINNDKLIKGAIFKTKVLPKLILKYSYTSVLVLARQDRKVCLQILNLPGKLEKHIKLSISLPSPCCMRMSCERNAVYIVDNEKGCFGFNLKGDVLFNYTHTQYDIFNGLALDQDGALYFAAGKLGQGYKCVINLSPAGQTLGQINIRKTCPVQCVGNKLYVSCLNDQYKWVIGNIYV